MANRGKPKTHQAIAYGSDIKTNYNVNLKVIPQKILKPSIAVSPSRGFMANSTSKKKNNTGDKIKEYIDKVLETIKMLFASGEKVVKIKLDFKLSDEQKEYIKKHYPHAEFKEIDGKPYLIIEYRDIETNIKKEERNEPPAKSTQEEEEEINHITIHDFKELVEKLLETGAIAVPSNTIFDDVVIDYLLEVFPDGLKYLKDNEKDLIYVVIDVPENEPITFDKEAYEEILEEISELEEIEEDIEEAIEEEMPELQTELTEKPQEEPEIETPSKKEIEEIKEKEEEEKEIEEIEEEELTKEEPEGIIETIEEKIETVIEKIEGKEPEAEKPEPEKKEEEKKEEEKPKAKKPEKRKKKEEEKKPQIQAPSKEEKKEENIIEKAKETITSIIPATSKPEKEKKPKKSKSKPKSTIQTPSNLYEVNVNGRKIAIYLVDTPTTLPPNIKSRKEAEQYGLISPLKVAGRVPDPTYKGAETYSYYFDEGTALLLMLAGWELKRIDKIYGRNALLLAPTKTAKEHTEIVSSMKKRKPFIAIKYIEIPKKAYGRKIVNGKEEIVDIPAGEYKVKYINQTYIFVPKDKEWKPENMIFVPITSIRKTLLYQKLMKR